MATEVIAECWVLTWEADGHWHVLDVADREDAERLAVRLTESGRRNVGLFRAAMDIPPGTRERIWQRVRERLEREMPDSLVREAAG
jgi:hypothetical protein